MSVPYPIPGTEKEGLYPSLPSAPLENPPPYTPTPDRNEIEEELHKIEDEISTLKAVLISKQERAAQLKRQLGMYGFDVAKDDMKRAAQSIANSKPYTTVKSAVTKQWNNVTNTNAYKSVNNSVSSFFKSVKPSIRPSQLTYHQPGGGDSSFSGDSSASTPGSAKQAQSRASVPSSSTTHLTQPI